VSFILGCSFQDPSDFAFQTASPTYFGCSREHRALLCIRRRDQIRLSENETQLMFSEQGKQVAVEKISLRDLSGATVKPRGKGRDRIQLRAQLPEL